MGLSSTTNRVAFACDGSSTVFPFPYYFFQTSDLAVYLWDTVAGGVQPQTLNTNYTISGNKNSQGVFPSGGNVVMNSAALGNFNLIITRSPAQVQNYVLNQNGSINSLALVQEFDYLTALVQRLQDEVGRSIQLADGQGSSFSTFLPSTTPLQANAPIVVNSGGNGFTYGTVLSSGSSAFSFFGTLPTVNGGTGQTANLTPFAVWYSLNPTTMAQTNAGTNGQFLTANGSAAPSFTSFSLSSPGLTGVLPVGLGGTGFGSSYPQGGVLYASSTTQVAGSPTTLNSIGSLLIASGAQVLADYGSVGAPGISFANEAKSGLYRIGSSHIAAGVGGSIALDMILVGTSVCFGFGGTAANVATNPLSAYGNFNGQVNFNYSNYNQGTASGTILYVGAGASGANGITIENQAFANTVYSGGGGMVSAGPNLSFLNICAENTGGFMTFNVGGRTLATERMRLTQGTSLALNSGLKLVMQGSSVSGGSITISTANSSASYPMVWPQAQSGASQFLKNDGSGNLSWSGASVSFIAPQVQIFNSSGSFTYTVPAGAIALDITLVSGGCGGGGTASAAAGSGAGGGGAGGNAAFRLFANSSGLAASYNVVVGAGGPGGAAGNNSGAFGSSSIFGSSALLTPILAFVGGGGSGSASTATSGITSTGGQGANSPIGQGGDYYHTGGAGGNGITFAVSSVKGGAGGTSFVCGPGAESFGTSAGAAAFTYGGGGGGGSQVNNGGVQKGGDGINGIVIIKALFT